MTRIDLQTALDALIKRQRIKLYRERSVRLFTWKTVPSLWEMLVASADWAGSGSGGGAFGSRPTISTGVVALVMDISTAAAEGAEDLAGRGKRTVPGQLLAIVAALSAGRDLDQQSWWAGALTRWVREARAELKLDPVRPHWARGVACPACGALYATSTTPGVADGLTVRTPSMAITWSAPEDDQRHHPDTDWKVRAVECRACLTTWWRGPDLDLLVDAMLAANLSRETLAG